LPRKTRPFPTSDQRQRDAERETTSTLDKGHGHPNCDSAARGATSYTDFLIFAASVAGLSPSDDGKRPPEVLRGLDEQRADSLPKHNPSSDAEHPPSAVRHFTTAVFDLVPLPENWRDGVPSKDDPFYYYRPWKTILTCTVADGGQSFYIQADHRQSTPSLWQALTKEFKWPPRAVAPTIP